MILIVQKRAEVALRSLSGEERDKVSSAINDLLSLSITDFSNHPKIHAIRLQSGEKLYTYRLNNKLRLVLSIDDDTCVVQDLVNYDRFTKLLHNRGQQ